jgi:chloramphenicol-sensitive protein RarD
MSTASSTVPPDFDPVRETRNGLLGVIGAFLIWGLLPLYLRQMHMVPALQIMSHRLVWCCLFVMIWLALRGQLGGVRAALADRATVLKLCASAVLISINWITYVWGVNNGHVVESSLGYFINPLVNVLLGVVILSERLNRAQWAAVAIATAGVVWLTIQAGRPPWIALTLAASFGTYGLIRKVVRVDAIAGLATETLLIAPFGLAFLLWSESRGSGVLGHAPVWLDAMLIGGGVVTAIPLALFAYGARRIPYSTVGLVQYIGPTIQLLLGVFLWDEPFGGARLIGFALIWTALAIYAVDGVVRNRRARRVAMASSVD